MADEEVTPDDVNLDEPKTAAYQSINMPMWGRLPKDLPPFRMLTAQYMLIDPTIRLGLAMRAAPLCAAEFAYKDPSNDDSWKPGIQAENSAVGDYVHRQLVHIWQNELPALLESQGYGWSAAEVTGRQSDDGLVDIDRLYPRDCNDVRVRVFNGEPVGVRFLRIKDVADGQVDLDFPNCIWNPFNPRPGQWYSEPVTFGAYSPWWSKWMNGGALDTLELFMHKSAFGGAKLTYPAGSTPVPGKGDVPNSQTAREMIEQYNSGGVITKPHKLDANGNQMWEWEEATVPAYPKHILEYPDKLDCWMLRGMEIPDDVLTAEATGAWAGKIVPMSAFYTGLDLWLRRIILNLKRQVIDKYVILNFGRLYWYEITTKPLALQAMEQQGANKADDGPQAQYGQPMRQTDPGMQGESQAPTQMSLERMVGKGMLDAAKVVRMASRAAKLARRSA